MAYTKADTPTIVTRIEKDLHHVLDAVRQHDPALRALVLTGGFARGEGAVCGGEPQNDYDMVAIRGKGRPEIPYDRLRPRLEKEIGLHLDLAPVPAWRLQLAAPSIFWYETALRGKVFWGEDLLAQIPIRDAAAIPPAEGLRMLVNRAAGLLLATRQDRDHDVKVQAAKGLLAAMDARLLASRRFAPSQTERWRLYCRLHEEGRLPQDLRDDASAYAWAFAYKTGPETAPPMEATQAWDHAARAVRAAVPTALRASGFADLDAYARSDGLVDRLYFTTQAGKRPYTRRFAAHPTGQVRVATLRLLETAMRGELDAREAMRHLGRVVRRIDDPVDDLEGLRQITLQ